MATVTTPYRLPYGAFTPIAPRRPRTATTPVSNQPTMTQAPTQPGPAPAPAPAPMGGGFVPQEVQMQAQGVNTSDPYAPRTSTPPTYPTASATQGFQPRSPIPRPPVQGSSPDYINEYQRTLTGSNFGDIIAPGGSPIRRGDVPLLEAALNFENLGLAERDREMGYEQLARARGDVGESPEMQLALALASRRAGGDTPFGQQFVETQRSALKDRSALARQGALRNLQADFARRGIGGLDPAMASALLEQENLGQLSGQLGDLEQNAAIQREASERGSFADLYGAANEQEGRRAALDQALSQVFLDTERAPIDLSGLLQPLPTKIAGMPLNESQQLSRTYKDLSDYPEGLNTRPESMSQKQWQRYINAERPEGMNNKDWIAELKRRGILDAKGRWVSSLKENKLAAEPPQPFLP